MTKTAFVWFHNNGERVPEFITFYEELPAGEFSIVRDPGSAAVALWQKT